MWKVVEKIGDKTLYKCSECDYQLVAKIPPAECPNCGEITPRTISLDRSTIDIDEGEVDVYQYERDVPAYKLWYFWLILFLSIALISGAMFFVRAKMDNNARTGTEGIGVVSFTPPTGWTKESANYYVGPGETSEIRIDVCKVSVFTKLDECTKLIADLSGIEDSDDKRVNGIDGKIVTWKTRKVVDGEEIFTDFGRYVFIYNGNLYVVMFKSLDNTPEVFDTFLQSMSK